MTDYEHFKELRTWNCIFDDITHHPENLKILLVSSDERKRLAACEFVKEVLEEKLKDEKSQGNLQEYEVAIIDIAHEKSDFPFEYIGIFERSGIHDGRLFIPIYHNADKHRDLPQIVFDGLKPGILSYTPEGFWNIVNYSKRNCYRRLNV
jgi:hypothetical protein